MAKIALLVPLHNQESTLERVIKGMETQTLLPTLIYFLVDRGSKSALSQIKETINKSTLASISKIVEVNQVPVYMGNPPTNGESPFLAGHVRNVGIDKAIEDECDIFIFIDGDCIPQKSLVQTHVLKLNLGLPALTIGRRRESIYRWQDKREVDTSLYNLKLFRDGGVIINNPQLLEKSLIVWTCNIGINLKAVKLLKEFNNIYYKRKEVFSSEFLGKWGGEDGFLGIQAYYCRIFITTLGQLSSGVEHIDHPRPSNVYNDSHMNFFKDHCDRLRKKITINPMNLEFFST